MRVEHIGDATLYLSDFRDVLASEWGRADAVLADPPYGINYRSNHNSSRRGKWARWVRHENMPGIIGDDKPLEPEPILALNLPTVLFGGNYCADRLPTSRCWIIWDKRGEMGKNNQADCEIAWTNLEKPSRIFTHLWSGLIRAGEENISIQPKYHPHQKPVALLVRILEYMEAGHVILDTHMGSGSTGIAAIRTGRAFVGCEIDPGYFEIACSRIREAIEQPRFRFKTRTNDMQLELNA